GHRAGRPVRGYPGRQSSPGARGRRQRVDALCQVARDRCGARSGEGEPQGTGRARARVDRSTDEQARVRGSRGRAEHGDRRGRAANRCRHSRRPGGARRGVVGARAAIRGWDWTRRGALRAGAGRGDAGVRGERLMIRVAVAGAAGRMGQTVCQAIEGAVDMEVVARGAPALGTSVAGALSCSPEVMVDFTVPETALANARAAVDAGVHAVIGTTGYDPAQLASLQGSKANVFVAPNFAIGAVLMMQFA